MKKYITTLLAVSCALAAFSMPVSALEYSFDGADAGEFGKPTSVETIYVSREQTNIDRSKNAAYIPPVFGSPTSYTLNAGELLTPNLVGDAVSDGNISSGGGATVMPPAAAGGTSADVGTAGTSKYTAVTSDLYYSGGYLGTLNIPSIGLTVRVYQGTDSAALVKGAGHFNNHFGKIHTLNVGDTIKLTTKLGERSYEVYSVAKISADDTSVLNDSTENIITLVTCVMNQPDYRWCVQARQK